MIDGMYNQDYAITKQDTEDKSNDHSVEYIRSELLKAQRENKHILDKVESLTRTVRMLQSSQQALEQKINEKNRY
jgi:uncharacterized protein with FMN-binding domain